MSDDRISQTTSAVFLGRGGGEGAGWRKAERERERRRERGREGEREGGSAAAVAVWTHYPTTPSQVHHKETDSQ